MEITNVRKPVYAGSFYPEDDETLGFVTRQYIESASSNLGREKLRAIIVPHAGYVYSGDTAGYSYKLLRNFAGRSSEKLNVFLIGPSHQFPASKMALGSYDAWHTPLGEIKVSPIAKDLSTQEGFIIYDQAHLSEHSLEVQMPFLQTAMGNRLFEIIPMLCSKTDVVAVVDVLNKYANDDNSIIIVSTDLSHYLSYDQANYIDKKTIECVEKVDLEGLLEHGDACGLCGLSVLLQLAKMNKWKSKLLDYRTSGDSIGSKQAVVGYMAAYFYK